MNVELNDKRYIYIVEEDNGETYDMYFEDITMITTDYDFAVSVLEKKRYKKDTFRWRIGDDDGAVTYFERTKKKGVDRWAADSNGARITRQKLTIPK